MKRRRDRSEDLRATILRLRGGSGPWCGAYGSEPWQGVGLGDEAEPAISFWVSEPVTKSEPRGLARRAAHWLFIQGGMSLVVILGLIIFSLIASVLGFR